MLFLPGKLHKKEVFTMKKKFNIILLSAMLLLTSFGTGCGKEKNPIAKSGFYFDIKAARFSSAAMCSVSSSFPTVLL